MNNRLQILNVYFITVVVAACSLVYELMCAQALSLLAANMVKWYSLTIGVFLAAMGIGALNVHRLSKYWGTWSALFYVEISLSTLGAIAVLMLRTAHVMYSYLHVHGHQFEAQVLFYGSAFLIIFLVGLLTGLELPLLIQAGNNISGANKETNRVLGVDYIGSLIGAIAFPLFLLPRLNLISIGFLMAALNGAVAGLIIAQSPRRAKPPFLKLALAGLFLGLLITGVWNAGYIDQYFIKKYYYFRPAAQSLSTLFAPMDAYPKIIRERSPYQNIDLVQAVNLNPAETLIYEYSTKFAENPNYPNAVSLFLNGDFQLFSRNEEIYHEFFAHVPIIKTGTVPDEILVLGAGDGILLRELLKYPQVRSITHVDLDPVLVSLANTQPILRAMNNGALQDPRVHTIVGDGYQYVRKLNRKFSAIYIDFPEPVDYNLAKLYSAEFFFFIRKHLAEGGFAVFDSAGIARLTEPDDAGQRALLPFNTWPVFYNTLRKAGFATILPYLTTLGPTNQKAWERLNHDNPAVSATAWAGSSEAAVFSTREEYLNERNRRISALLESFSLWYQQGFIMVVNGNTDSRDTYRDFGIKLHLLNAERFYLAFSHEFYQSEWIDESQVNSIMRPTLPLLPINYIRLPQE